MQTQFLKLEPPSNNIVEQSRAAAGDEEVGREGGWGPTEATVKATRQNLHRPKSITLHENALEAHVSSSKSKLLY